MMTKRGNWPGAGCLAIGAYCPKILYVLRFVKNNVTPIDRAQVLFVAVQEGIRTDDDIMPGRLLGQVQFFARRAMMHEHL